MKKIIISILTILLFTSQNSYSEDNVGIVSDYQGHVKVLSLDGTNTFVKKDMPIKLNDKIITKNNSSVSIIFTDKSWIEIEGDEEIIISDYIKVTAAHTHIHY